MSDVKVEILKDTVAGKKRRREGRVIMVSEDDFRILKASGRARKSDKDLSPEEETEETEAGSDKSNKDPDDKVSKKEKSDAGDKKD